MFGYACIIDPTQRYIKKRASFTNMEFGVQLMHGGSSSVVNLLSITYYIVLYYIILYLIILYYITKLKSREINPPVVWAV